ncbi:hypothetical protein KAU33_04400 [Candidatus Dependentiae bacterium]|nr:hypothetical protein [Candidatus Dependentiae bacterium]
MSDQIPECKKAFNCLECDCVDKCKKWTEYKEKEKARALELAKEMPLIVKYFGLGGLKEGTIEDWREKLAKMSFGC